MKKESKELFFVEVREPKEVKRNILESLKGIVENLQRFEKFKETRKAKIEAINKLGASIKEINKLLPSLKNLLPEAKIRAVRASKQTEKQKTFVKKKS